MVTRKGLTMKYHVQKRLQAHIVEYLKSHEHTTMINVGAGAAHTFEDRWTQYSFTEDRLDIEPFTPQRDYVRRCFTCSAEDMKLVPSNEYDLAFSNFVLEHVEYLDDTAEEVVRVLKPGGLYIATIPNPKALEFRISKLTPVVFHKLIRGSDAWETHYEFKGIQHLVDIFKRAGLEAVDIEYAPAVEEYLERFPVVNLFGKLYDSTLKALNLHGLMGQACIVFKALK